MNEFERAIATKVCSVIDAMTEFELRAFLSKSGVNFDGCPTCAADRSLREYKSDWGNGTSRNNDVFFKDAYQEAHITGLNAVMGLSSNG